MTDQAEASLAVLGDIPGEHNQLRGSNDTN
jgi:hypothetical protein